MYIRDKQSGLYVPDRRIVRHRQQSPLWQGGQQQVMLAQRIAAGGGFDPSLYGTPVLWLVADDVTGSDADPVTTWPFRTYGSDATQATSGNKPIIKRNIINGKSAVRFATDDFLATSGSIAYGTIFAVLNYYTTGSGCAVASQAANNRYACWQVAGDQAYNQGDGGNISSAATFLEDSIFHHFCLKTGAGGAARFYIDGTQRASGTTGTITSGTTVIGAENRLTGSYMNGDLAWVLVFSDILNDTNRIAVQDAIDAEFAL